jgi:membrane-associated protein
MPLLATATLALNRLDAHSLPAGVGALGVFAGTGLLMGFFLPGDSSLFTARFA